MVSKTISGSTFYADVSADIAKAGYKSILYNDGDLQYIGFGSDYLHMILRTKEELFSATVSDTYKTQKYQIIANGNQYDVTYNGIMDALVGHDPVPATETTPLGYVVYKKKRIAGTSEPNRFYISYDGPAPIPMRSSSAYNFGFGDPPTSAFSALGGLGPIIINKLKYGINNQYKSGVPGGAPPVGPPGPVYEPYLVQRSNATYAAMAAKGARVGKVAIALSRDYDILLVLVQPDGAPSGISLDGMRNKLVSVGTDDAVFMDGSDSAMLVHNGVFLVSQGDNKDETNTIGFAVHNAP